MKKYQFIWFFLLILMVGITGAAFATETYYIWNDWGGTWHDSTKTWTDDNDMCWAAVAANVLAWGGWGTPSYTTAQAIFDKFKSNCTNEFGHVGNAWAWWVNGIQPYSTNASCSGGGNYWPTSNFYDYYYQSASDNSTENPKLMRYMEDKLRAGWGVVISIYQSYGHVLTVWGFDYDPTKDRYTPGSGYYKSIHVTDSGIYGTNKRVKLETFLVQYDAANSRYYLLEAPANSSSDYNNWYVRRVYGFNHHNLCGNLGGQTLAPGTYDVTCNISVDAGQSLHIMPGVTLNYNGHSFTVNGQLIWGP